MKNKNFDSQVRELLQKGLHDSQLTESEIQRGLRFCDLLLVQKGSFHFAPAKKAQTIAAALEYALSRFLYINLTRAEAAAKYEVSESSVSLHFKTIAKILRHDKTLERALDYVLEDFSIWNKYEHDEKAEAEFLETGSELSDLEDFQYYPQSDLLLLGDKYQRSVEPLRKAFSALAQGYWQEAANNLEMLTEIEPEQIELQKWLCFSLIQAKEIKKAQALIGVLKKKNGADTETNSLEIMLLAKEKKYADAKSKAQIILDKEPNLGSLWLLLGEIFLIENNLEKALNCFEKASQILECPVFLKLKLALFHSKLGSSEKALELARETLKILNSQKSTEFDENLQSTKNKKAFLIISKILFQAGQLKESCQVLLEAAALYSFDAQIHFFLASHYMAMNDLVKAQEAWQKITAWTLLKDYQSYYIAGSFLALGKLAKAAEICRKIIRHGALNSDLSAAIYFLLGIISFFKEKTFLEENYFGNNSPSKNWKYLLESYRKGFRLAAHYEIKFALRSMILILTEKARQTLPTQEAEDFKSFKLKNFLIETLQKQREKELSLFEEEKELKNLILNELQDAL